MPLIQRRFFCFATCNLLLSLFFVVSAQGFASIESKLRLPDRYRYERVVTFVGLKPGERRVIADLEGPGCIRHFYTSERSPRRNFILRIYWDGEEHPSVEAPVRDFFGIHHPVSHYPINSYYLSATDNGGFASYFPMPFSKSARLEIESITGTGFRITLDWHKYLTDDFDEKLRFHASWRQESQGPAWGEDFFAMDAVGRGYLMGFSLGVQVRVDDIRWSHAGSENIYIDGEATGEDGIVPHYLRAAGGENTFDTGFGGVKHKANSHLYAGIPYYEYYDEGPALARHRLSAYKFYVHDLMPFNQSIHFRWGSNAHGYCMTTYWYQTEPHRAFVRMSSYEDLEYPVLGYPKPAEPKVLRGKYDLIQQIGAKGPDSFLASPEDGTWSLFWGDEALSTPVTELPKGIHRRAVHGFIDFSHVLNVKSIGSNTTFPATATAITKLNVDDSTTATLHLSWDDTLRMRLNDGPVQDLGNHQPYKYRAVKVDLQKGTNTLRLCLNNPARGLTWGAFTYSCRVVLPNGQVVLPQIAK